MKFRALMFATLLVGIPSASLACGSANSDHFDEDERLFLSELEDEQIEYLARNLNLAQNDLVLFPGAAFVRHIDLDRDGTNEICLSLQTTATCSNGVGVCRILVLKDWSTEPLLFFTGHLLVAERSPEDSVATLIEIGRAHV